MERLHIGSATSLLETGITPIILRPNRKRQHRLHIAQQLFADDMFTELRVDRRVPADVVATVMVLEVLDGLSDRDAIGQLRMNSGW